MKISPRTALVLVATAACSGSATEPIVPPPADKPAPVATGLDGRTRVPLTAMMATHQKQQMRDHLRVVQEIAMALTADDFDAIRRSASRIGWSDQQAMMCKHMGAATPGFAEVGEHFHRTADTIVDAAKRRDRAGVTAALGATLQICVGCHDTYQQEITDEPALAPAAGSAGMDPNCPMHGN